MDNSKYRWTKVTCTTSTDSLCTIDTKNHVQARLFPDEGEIVYSLFGTHSMEASMGRVLSTECTERSTNRVLSTTHKDISLCDVLGTGNDYLFLPYERLLYVLQEPTSVPILITISILTVYMTVILAHSLEFVVNPSESTNIGSGLISLSCMVVLILISIFPTGNPDVWEKLVTMEDECALSILLVYEAYHLTRLCRKQSLREHTVNTILGILGIVSLCYYNTMDNPYTVIVTLIMSARLFYKLHYLSVVPVDDVVGDSVIVAVLIYTGIIPQLNYNPTVVALYTFQGLCVSITMSKIVLHMEKKSVSLDIMK